MPKKTGISVSLLDQYEEGKEDIDSAGLLILLKICKSMDYRLPEILTDKETIN